MARSSSILSVLSTFLMLFIGWHIISTVPIASKVGRHRLPVRGQGGGGGDSGGESSSSSSPSKPVMQANFADPSVLRDVDGRWYAFGTEGNGKHLQIARAPALTGPWELLDRELLPKGPAWGTGHFTWAPAAARLDNGTYVLYYSAQAAATGADGIPHQAIGAATAPSVLGPYTPAPPENRPFAGNVSEGGAIDASGFRDPADGRRYVVYKVDGNSLGSGGACGLASPSERRPTPLLLQEVSRADGVTAVGPPHAILDRTEADGPLVEAPSLLRARDGRYVLLYSSGCFSDDSYRTSYAIADRVTGPYVRARQPLMRSGDALGLTAPGGAAFAPDGSGVVFHADCPEGRCMHVSRFSIDRDNNIKLGA